MSFIARTYWLLISAMLLIPTLGLTWEYFHPHESISAFARSGALLIAFTLTMAWHNHHKTIDIELIEMVLGATAPESTKDILRRPQHLVQQNNANDNKERAEARKTTNDAVFDKLKKQRDLLKDRVDKLSKPVKAARDNLTREKANIVKAEFFGGICGTIIWGFGDLPGKYLAEKTACLL